MLHPGLIFLQCAAPEIFNEANQATLLGIALDDMLENDLVQEAIRINLVEVAGRELVWHADAAAANPTTSRFS